MVLWQTTEAQRFTPKVVRKCSVPVERIINRFTGVNSSEEQRNPRGHVDNDSQQEGKENSGPISGVSSIFLLKKRFSTPEG